MLDEYRQGYTEFNSAITREYYLHYSGQKLDFAIAPIYNRHADLFDPESVAKLRRILDDTPLHFETGRTSARHLLIFALNNMLDNSVKDLTERLTAQEARATIAWDGRRMTFQDSAVAMATEPDREARLGIYSSRTKIIKESNDLRRERLAKLYLAARSTPPAKPPAPPGRGPARGNSNHGHPGRLDGFSADGCGLGVGKAQSGCPSYTALYEDLYQLDYSVIDREAQSILAGTESVYVARLDEALKADLGISVDAAQRADAMYLLHLDRYGTRFPPEGILRVYSETMAGLGIAIETQKNIQVDSEPRPRKSPRAFCAPIIVPNEIRLVIRPCGGQSDYVSFFHEAGHAQHYGWASPALLPELKYTGDAALTETYAFLFNHLPCDPLWLSRFLGFDDSEDFIRRVMLTKLITLRKYAAKLIYEHHLHTQEDLGGAGPLYSRLQTEATRFATKEVECFSDIDDAFYSADYLRAWAFEVLLREYLKARFGTSWWASRRAGSFLKEIWETGDLYTADEMAAQIGVGPISFDLLIDELIQALR